MEIKNALSIRQPWASLIIGTVPDVPIKPIENRSWYTHFRGPLLIHASKTYDKAGHRFIVEQMGYQLPEPAWFPTGGIIGSVNMTDCVIKHVSEWFAGPYGFLFSNPEPLDFRPMSGQLGIFQVANDRPAVILLNETIVLNMRTDADLVQAAKEQGRYVYIGRPREGQFWGWGNPFSPVPGNKALVVVNDAIEAHKEWLDGRAWWNVMPDLREWQLEHIHELKGKALVCFCGSGNCHGDYLKELADEHQ